MFKKETVFILGAGASKPFGYPLGKDLISKIIKNTHEDIIYLPKPTHLLRKYIWLDCD